MAEREDEMGERNDDDDNRVVQKQAAQQAKESKQKRGLIYLSWIPPKLKPKKVKRMLSEHAEVGRVYLVPESETKRKRRQRNGKDSGRHYEEGWVEFMDKRVARRVAGLLNGQKMGGKKRSKHYHDLWSMTYLPRFKWEHLVEEMAMTKHERAMRRNQEAQDAAEDKQAYMELVGKADDSKHAQRRLQDASQGAGVDQEEEGKSEKPQSRRIRQRMAREREGEGSRVSSHLLRSIFE